MYVVKDGGVCSVGCVCRSVDHVVSHPRTHCDVLVDVC